MLSVGVVIWLGSLLLGLVALAAGLVVLRGIIREARERDPGEPTTPEPQPAAVDGRCCANCQTVNDPSFEYCSECAAKL